MPRAKVRPENRKRAAQACTHCRSAKKRCNGKHPCTNCVRKGVANLCSFEEVLSTALLESPRQTHTVSADRNRGSLASVTGASITSQSRIFVPSPAVTIGTQISSPEASHRTQSRLLENSRGEKVFIGRSAPLSFLQYIRDTVSQSLGRSDFSNHVEQNRMFEGSEISALPVSDVPLGVQNGRAFVEMFFKVTPGLFDLFTKDQVSGMLKQYYGPGLDERPFGTAIMWSIIAIGAQCSVRDHQNLTISHSYFAGAQKKAFQGMIEDPCLEMVELFLLMAFYMLGACHRNAAFMYIGVAARAAYALGLHYEHFSPGEPSEANRQNRIGAAWKCLVTLDTIVSSILGRPSATSSRPTRLQGQCMPISLPRSHVNEAMQANYEMACLLDQKVQALYKSEEVTTERALACLDELTEWSARLPSTVKLASETSRTGQAQEQVVGGLHVSCFYYFAVMLVSRPFLVVHLTKGLAKPRLANETLDMNPGDADVEADMQEIADACLNAAVYTVETCIETQSHGYLPDNMRVLKAWIFAAGLVLGFEMFTSNQSPQEFENAFRNSCKLLEMLSYHSPLAAHYHDILKSLSDAVSARRRQARQERRRSNRPIVGRIMAFKTPEAGIMSDSILESPHVDTTPAFTQPEYDMNRPWTPGVGPDFDFEGMMNEPFLNWDSADFLVWDPFSHEMPA